MEIQKEDYQVWFEPDTQTVFCKGSFRLQGPEEYAPLVEFLNQASQKSTGDLTLDLRQLEYLNSMGINIFSKFVITVRQKKDLGLVVVGSKNIPWQGKSLINLQRLMPNLKLEFS